MGAPNTIVNHPVPKRRHAAPGGVVEASQKQRRLLASICKAALILLVTSCGTTPKYPHHSEVPDGPALPIDGEWANNGGLRIRIARGKAYTLNKNTAGTPVGSVLAKDILPLAEGRYACKAESHNFRLLDFGDGEIIVTGSTTLALKSAPNAKTGFTKPVPVSFRKITLDYEERYAAVLSAVLKGLKTNTNLTTLVSMGVLPEYRNSELALEALVAAVDLLKEGWETITEEEYRRNFTAPDGTLLPQLLHDIKQKRRMAKDESLTVGYFPGGETTLTTIKTGESKDGVVELSFSTHGLTYMRKEYPGESVFHEIVTRRGQSSGAAVTTEVFHIHGAIYRLSRVTGL